MPTHTLLIQHTLHSDDIDFTHNLEMILAIHTQYGDDIDYIQRV